METLINGIWAVELLQHRKDFHDARPKWERGRLEHCAERMSPGMVVYDIGAEEGDFTSLYRRWVGPTGDVIPIEPQPAYWPAIRATWELNGFPPPAAWFPGFAGPETTIDQFGSKLLTAGWPGAEWPTYSKKKIQPDFGFRHLAQQADTTPQVRMDTFAEMAGVYPDAIVMDIEGAECQALEGTVDLLLTVKPLVWVSVHEETMWNWYHNTLDDIHRFMSECKYVGKELPHHGEGETFWFFEYYG